MPLLFFLSAILAALTGASAGARVAEPQQIARAALADTATVAVALAPRPVRPANEAVAAEPLLLLPALAVAAAIPAYADRLRE